MKKIILAGIMAGMVMTTITGYGNTVNVMAASSSKKAAKTEKDKDEKTDMLRFR